MQFRGLEVVGPETQVPIYLGDDSTTATREQVLSGGILRRVRQGKHGGGSLEAAQAPKLSRIASRLGVGVFIVAREERGVAVDKDERCATDALNLSGDMLGILLDGKYLVEKVDWYTLDVEA